MKKGAVTMGNENRTKQKYLVGSNMRKAVYGIYDVFVSYFSFFTAIAIRFYANGEFQLEANTYLKPFSHFAPIYAVIVVIVFACFGLYNGKWKYAGYHDLIRIVAANFVTALIQFAAMNLFYGDMPLSYFCIGSLLQFIFVLFSRFVPRFMGTATNIFKRLGSDTTNVLIVGDGDLAVFARKLLEGHNVNSVFVRCFFSGNLDSAGSTIDGIPVEGNIDNLEKIIKNYRINYVCIADYSISKELTNRIKSICSETYVTVQSLPEVTYFDEYLSL